MELQPARRITKTKNIPCPNQYIVDIDGKYADYAFNEERVLENRENWRRNVFAEDDDYPLDLEIGTGNGFFFAQRSFLHPERGLVGLELKYKPLIQSIRRALVNGSKNARIARFHANDLHLIFANNELNNVFIHFPDPWPKRKQFKNRLIQNTFMEHLFEMQRPGSFVEFKTDHRGYFDWALKIFENSPYRVIEVTRDLHNSEYADKNFVTHFEKIFLRKGQPIFYVRLEKAHIK